MIALMAGTGALPGLLLARLEAKSATVLTAELLGNPATLVRSPDLTFRLETLGSFLEQLKDRGVTEVCFAGAIARPSIDQDAIDRATAPLVPRLMEALGQGDDGALRIVVRIFEEAAICVIGADQIAPDLLPPSGVLAGGHVSPALEQDAVVGAAHLGVMGRRDSGQACIVADGALIVEEGPEGTDAMLGAHEVPGGTLFKGPKPGQDRRVDLPVIGPDTVRAAATARLSAIVIEAGGVMVLDQPEVRRLCTDLGLTLWIRAR